jgi:fumarylpyruvate hydrolase
MLDATRLKHGGQFRASFRVGHPRNPCLARGAKVRGIIRPIPEIPPEHTIRNGPAMSYVLQVPHVPAVPIAGGEPGDQFPVRRIYCVGRNYVDHAIEMGHSGREPPFFFLKPGDTVLPVAEGQVGEMRYPSLTRDLQHEVELVVAIGRGGVGIRADKAMEHVWGYAVGLDMTRRDLQGEAKKLGRPWCSGKGFDQSAPIGPIRPASECRLTADTPISLEVNGAVKQHGVLGKMIWNVAEIIEKLSLAWELAPGDLIFTGTPAGVGAVLEGDTLHARIDGVSSLHVKIIGADAVLSAQRPEPQGEASP